MVAATKSLDTRPTSEIIEKMEHLQGQDKLNYSRSLSKEEKKSYLDFLKDRDVSMVVGVFKCFEPVGGSLVMSCRPWLGHEYKFTFEHGKEYKVPYAVAVQLERKCWWPSHSYILDAEGKPLLNIDKKNFRFSFNTGTIR